MKKEVKNAVSKTYFSHNRRFAEVCNHGLFGGEPVVCEEQLSDQDPSEQVVSGIKDAEALWKNRDILKRHGDGTTFQVIGIENQSEIHYCMPLRNLLYDAMNYEEQRRKLARKHRERKELSNAEFLSGFARTDRLEPVFTLVLYFGEEEWDGARTLTDLLDIPAELQPYKGKLPDYRINLLDVRRIENLDEYSDDLKALFGFIKYQKDKNALSDFIAENMEIFSSMSAESAQAIAVLANCREVERLMVQEMDAGKGQMDMCQALREMMEDAREEGRAEGREEGRKEGREEGRKEGRKEGRAEVQRAERENSIRILIEDNLDEGIAMERIVAKLVSRFGLTQDLAAMYFERFGAVL